MKIFNKSFSDDRLGRLPQAVKYIPVGGGGSNPKPYPLTFSTPVICCSLEHAVVSCLFLDCIPQDSLWDFVDGAEPVGGGDSYTAMSVSVEEARMIIPTVLRSECSREHYAYLECPFKSPFLLEVICSQYRVEYDYLKQEKDGITIMNMSWLVTWYTVWQLIQLHESDTGQRFDRYTELGQHAFGPKLGIWVVMPQQLVVQIGYSMIATGASIAKGVAFHHIVDYGFKAKTTPGIIFDIFSSLGVLAFAFVGLSVALEIQATIPSTPDKPSRRTMWSGVKCNY
ncbi:lysine histidine transporter-like 6 [Phtheirospermum japonicum]|uniref:Lysine histidine transporter-like 6 n=1 Tax=Phtheirospermum japonicum TaxID=374723 RepID=A0A830CEY3_9LAMI|nr:lysine histidine transporter-like 6 [Phtheirospermum japonicum]